MTIEITRLVTQLSQALKKRQWKLTTAESCTGGGLAYWITSVPGSSEWFDRGFVTYSNLAKTQMLNVNSNTLLNYGAVSAETAREMAIGALHQSAAQISIAITGIAGPDGGTPEKPVGTVWIATATLVSDPYTKLLTLSGNRTDIREQSIQIALENLLLFI